MWFNRRAYPRIRHELQFHRDRLIEDLTAAGLSLADAERRARLKFGDVAAIEERVKDVRGRLIEDFGRDVRYAARTLRRSAGFAATAGATLALAIGLSTVMFSVLNAVVLRPLPYRSPERLMMLWTDDPTQNLHEGRSALADVAEWRRESHSFADIATFDTVSATLAGTDGAEQLVGASVSPNLFALLGVQPAQGRRFSIEDAEQHQRVVLISDRFWQTHFGGARSAVGATLVLDGVPSRIIGVLPAGLTVARLDADVWEPHLTAGNSRDGQSGLGGTWFVIGRLRPAVTVQQAQAEMNAIAHRLDDELPASARNRGISVVPLSMYLVGPESRLALWMLGGAVFFVFLIAAVNVTSLSLARSASRAREMSVRAALGAHAARIVRQLIAESVLLAALSGLIGTLLAVVGVRFVRAFGPATLPRLHEVALDVRALGCALAISLLAGLLVGLAPAIAMLRRDVRPAGVESSRSVSGGGVTRRVRRALVVTEFALAIVLLAGAGLLVRSWWRVTSIDPGFRPRGVLVMELRTPASVTASSQRTELFRRVLEQIRSVPGVENAGIIGDLFIENPRDRVVTSDGNDGLVSEGMRLPRDEVSPGFFTAIGTPLLRGRFFSERDGADAPPVAIINDTMARRIWPGLEAVGKRFKLGAADSNEPWYTVVGVVGDMHRQGLERDATPQMFVSLAQAPPRSGKILIRTSSDDPLAMVASLRAAVRRVERNAALYGVAPLEQQLGSYLTQRRFETSLLIGFSAVALLMAAVGIYGLIQYSVATRTQEIGLRQAIGARPGDIFRMVVGEGLMLSGAGLILGLMGARWLGDASASLLFGVTAGDPVTFTTVSVLLIAVAIAASYLPARRAMKVDPVVALRAL